MVRGTLKMRERKMRDLKMRHQTAGMENAGLEMRHQYAGVENAGLESAGNDIVWNAAH